MANQSNRWAKQKLEEERAKRGYYCQNLECPFTNWELTFAHLRPTPVLKTNRGRGRKERVIDIHRNPGAYALLCWDCHRAFDHGGLTDLVLTIREGLYEHS